jgi:hypothetical protein
MTSNDPDNDRDPDRDHDESPPTGQAVAPAAPAAITSLTALSTMLNSASAMRSVLGSAGRPMMQFKSREDTWTFGQRRTIPEEGSLWAVNPTTFQHGYISFGDNDKPLGERLVSVGQPKPDVTTLPNTGFPWQEEYAVNLKCLSGADAGVEVVFKTNTRGGEQAVGELLKATRDRVNGGQHDGKVSPIVRLEKDFYPHGQYGRTNIPIMTIVDWMTMDGPAPAPAPTTTPPSDPHPRRRRVA